MNDKVTNKERLESLIEFAETNYGIKDIIMHSSDWSNVVFKVKYGDLTLYANGNFCLSCVTDKLIAVTTGQLGSFCNTKHFRRWQSNFEDVARKALGLPEETWS